MIAQSPARRIRVPRYALDEQRKVGLDKAETDRLLATANAGTPVEAGIVNVMVVLGLRVGEVCRIRIEDFGDTSREHVTLRLVGKGHKAATAPLPPRVLRPMKAAAGTRQSGILFLRDWDGLPHNTPSVARMLRRLAKDAGITKHMHPHLLRHTAVTAGLDAGRDIRDVQAFARHADPRTTMAYDRSRHSLDRHVAYTTAGYFAGGG